MMWSKKTTAIRSYILLSMWLRFSASARRLFPAGLSVVSLRSVMSKSSSLLVDSGGSTKKKSTNSSNLCSMGSSTMKLTESTETKQKALAELLVYLNRLRVIHGLSELDLLEVFNASGADLLKHVLEDKHVAVARPVTQKITVKPLKDSDTMVFDGSVFQKKPNLFE